jgi:predicted transcriptional regulator
MNSQRRKDFEILAQLLKETAKGSPKTRIRNLANLSQKSFKVYWSDLESRKLIRISEESNHLKLYGVTESGQAFLRLLEDMVKIWQENDKKAS